MIALAFLTPPALAQLRRVLPPPHHIWSARTWDDLIAHVARGRADVIVIDPCAGHDRQGDRQGSDRVRMLGRALARGPAAPVIGYVSVTAAAIHAVHALVRLGAVDIVVRGVDDAVDALGSVVHRATAASLADRLVRSVGNPFTTLPPDVAAALELLFRRPERLRSVSDLAAAASTTRRSLDRWLARAGLASARTLLSCARANAAFHLIAAGQLRTAHAATLLGYSSPRALARELQSLTGFAPSALPRHVSADAFVAALGPRLLRTASRPVATAGSN